MNNTRTPSQKSSQPPQLARQPRRQRGKDRVAGLLAAAARLFGRKGFDATTMTEIAAEAKASIGSLYQFFPSKPAIATALLQQYLQQLHAALDQVQASASGLDADHLALALMNLMLGLIPDRHLALMMLEGTDDNVIELRRQWRFGLRARIGEILQAWRPATVGKMLTAESIVVLQLMKAVPVLAEEFGQDSAAILELHHALQTYLQTLPRD